MLGREALKALSAGAFGRLAAARATQTLLSNPGVLLLDEPFGALDEPTRENLNVELLNFWGRVANTVLFVTHNVEESVFLSDRVMVLANSSLKNVRIRLVRPRDLRIRFTKRFQDYARKIRGLIE